MVSRTTDDQSADAELEGELRRSRKFTPQDALARLAGPGAMKGGSPVSRQQQAENSLAVWLRSHGADDPAGIFAIVLLRQLKGSELLLGSLDRPLNALKACCGRIVATDHLLQEFVREADVEWGRAMGERPYFDRAGALPHPDDPYTIQSARAWLADIIDQLGS